MQPPTHPAFRRLDTHVAENGDQRGVVLVDPIGLIDEQVFVPDGLLPILGRFDGIRSTEQIQAEVEQEFPGQVEAGLVAKLVGQLDERLLLLSPRFEAALQEQASAFTAQPARPARHAGSAGYPESPDQLREALGAMIGSSRTGERPAPRGLIAPHIDLARGREGYVQAYGYLAECEPADLYVIFGTGHQGPSAPVTGLRLDWETPLGTVPTSRAFIDAVHADLGEPEPLDVFLHRDEHSVEFQVLFLKHVLGDHPFEVACFLTGHLAEVDGTENESAAAVLDSLQRAAKATGKKVCYVAGADLAHIGPMFGDEQPVDAARLERLATTEKQHLSFLERSDPSGFHRSVEGPGNPDRICGTAPMYLTAALAGGAGELLYYGQADASQGEQVVSYCAMAFEG